MTMLLLLLLLPVLAAALSLLARKSRALSIALAAIVGIANLCLAALVFRNGLSCLLPIELHGFTFVFDAGASSPFLLLAAAIFLPVAIYTAAYFHGKGGGAFSLCFYISMGMINGALLAGHIGLTLLFWEGLLCTLFGMLVSGNHENDGALRRGFALSGTSDLILMFGIVAVMHAAHTGTFSEMAGLSADGFGALGAICLLLGALGKAGAFPFHAWIIDAAKDAHAPFAAAFPGALYTILGGYLALRITSTVYTIPAGSGISILLVIIGILSLVIGAYLSLRQRNLKEAIACIGIAQAGMIAFGLSAGGSGFAGAALQIGVGALGVSGLQMVAGAIEKKTGRTEVKQLGNLWRKMPAAAISAIVLAASIAGFPFLGGFFASASTLQALGVLPAILFLGGQLLIALALSRLVGASFFVAGKEQAILNTSGASIGTVCAVILAVASILLPIFHPALLAKIGIENAANFAQAPLASAGVCAVVALAAVLYALRAKKGEQPKRSNDSMRKALEAEGALDTYRWLMGLMGVISRVSSKIEEGVSWVYDVGIPSAVKCVGNGLSRSDTGSLARYLTLAVVGMLVIGLIFVIGLL